MIAQIQMRRGTTAEWAAAHPVVLAEGEPGYDSTLKLLKIGDGVTNWASLPFQKSDNSDKLDGVHLADIRLGQNILHNWDFRNPVNQRGVTGALAYYGLDRWMHVGSSYYTPGSGYIQLYTGARIDQKVEGPLLNGKVVTLSVWTEYGLFSQVYTVSPGNGSIIFGGGRIRAWVEGYATYTFVQIEMLTGTKIYAVKLELGTVSTLHLDPPMDHAVELPKCQRFLMPFLSGVAMAGYTNSSESAVLFYPTPVQMRIHPTLPPNTEVTCLSESVAAFYAIPSTILATASGVRLVVNSSGLTAWKPLTGFPGYSTFLSAEL